MHLSPPCQKLLVKTLKTFRAKTRTDERFVHFRKEKNFSPNCSSEHAQWFFGKTDLNLLPRIRGNFPNSKNVDFTICWTKFFFHQKRFFNNGKCNFDNASKNVSLRIHRFAAQIPKTTKKNYEFFERKITFLKMFLCKSRRQLWPPWRNFLVKALKTFFWNSVNDENLISFPKNLFSKMFVWTCATNFWQACRNLVAKNTKNFSELQKCWSYNLLNKTFFHQKRLFSNGECNFDNASDNFSLKIYRFAAQNPNTTWKSLWIFRKEHNFPQNVPMYI